MQTNKVPTTRVRDARKAKEKVLAFLKVINAMHQDHYYSRVIQALALARTYEAPGFPTIDVSNETLMFMYSSVARISPAEAYNIVIKIEAETGHNYSGLELAARHMVLGLIDTYTQFLQNSN
jgi:limonene-1,2-epoxide hydrolase